jgi:hypothetical protein
MMQKKQKCSIYQPNLAVVQLFWEFFFRLCSFVYMGGGVLHGKSWEAKIELNSSVLQIAPGINYGAIWLNGCGCNRLKMVYV